MAIAAAAKLPTFCTPAAAAAPVELDDAPEPVAEAEKLAEAAVAVVRPRLDAALTPEAEVTTVVVQEQSLL